MKEVMIESADRYGYDFVPPEYLLPGKDEFGLRNQQIGYGSFKWRKLRAHEIEILVKNENYCANWDDFLVSDPFDPNLIRNSHFYGLVRIGALRNVLLKHHDFRIPAGIRNCTIISTDIGDDCSIQDCPYISHYIIGNQVILSRVDEMQTTNHAKFGNGALKDGEDESVRVWIDVMNEAGGRSILPFEDMICADAYLWAVYRDDEKLIRRLKDITQAQYGGARGAYGEIGEASVLKSCGIIKDVKVGSCAYIKGANKLKNLTILSSEAEPTQIGEGVELVNGIVGYGCRIFYGSKAVRFVMGRNSSLKYGGRLIHSVLGDNSNVSCCEMLNNLVFPAHEQHHNNSFLIASLVQGLSNMAAGATVGSNHNSRANDGEIRAGRGFWPGLSVTLKHSSRFASYVLIAKGNYPYELNIPFPFALVNHDVSRDRLEVMPAYFWMYNLYALERNAWKASARDTRPVKVQKIETRYLAPDTAEEIIGARALIERWVGHAKSRADGKIQISDQEAEALGRTLLSEETDQTGALEILAYGLERHSRPAVILKARRAWRAYGYMLRYYGTLAVAAWMEAQAQVPIASLLDDLAVDAAGNRCTDWVNLGGQIVPASRLDALRRRIGDGELDSWRAIHAEYDAMAEQYPWDTAVHGMQVLLSLMSHERDGDRGPTPGALSPQLFRSYLERALETRRWIEDQVYRSREKDFKDPFRAITFRNKEEMTAVVGTPQTNSFVILAKKETQDLEQRIHRLLSRL